MIILANFLEIISYFGIITLTWIIISFLITLSCLIIHYFNQYLPRWFCEAFMYGKLLLKKNTFVQKIEIPKNWFSHFYIFGLMTLGIVCAINFMSFDTSLILELLFGKISAHEVNKVPVMLLISFIVIHLCRRLFETFFIHKPSQAKMNFIHYAVGNSFYISLALVCLKLLNDNKKFEKLNLTPSLIFWISINVLGQIIQFHSHYILSLLRTKKIDKKCEYFIPSKGLFEWISCPNYFSELLIYLSFFAITNFHSAFYGLIVWVVSNQLVSAKLSHNWYLHTFETYPKNRRAIIPLIF